MMPGHPLQMLFISCTLVLHTFGPRLTLVHGQSNGKHTETALSGEIDLTRLIDLCAAQLEVNIDYDPGIVFGRVTLRLDGPVSDDELWSLTNRLLGLLGLTTIQTDPDNFPDSYAIVKLSEAPGLAAAVERDRPQSRPPGYASIVLRVEHITPESAISAVKNVLSRSGSNAITLGDDGLILLADLQSRLDQALRILSLIDVPGEETRVERIVLMHQSAMQLATTLTAIASAQETFRGSRQQTNRAQFIASSDERAILIVAPAGEIDHWRMTIEEFDSGATVETRIYTPRYFALDEVARLIEDSMQSARSGVRDSRQSPMRVVRDNLTGALIITATPREHDEVQRIIDRLNAAPAEARRPLRTFKIENRAVADLKGILDELINAGMLDVTDGLDGESQVSTTGDTGSTPTEAVRPSLREALDRTGSQVSSVLSSREAASGRDRPRGSAINNQSASSLWLTADDGTNTLISVGDPRRLDQLESLIQTLDVRQPQVMIEAMIVTLTEGQTLDLGVELQKIELSGDTLIRLSSLFGLAEFDDEGSPSLSDPRGGTALVLNPGDFSVVVRALKTVNDGRSLNVPKVLVNNNEVAILNSVLQEPFASINASDTVATTSFSGTQDAGTTITVKPQTAEGDHVVLEYSASLSSFVGESSDPSLPPPRQQNSLESIATIPDGYVVVVGGLDVTQEAEAVSQVPLIGDIPLFGELFKTRSKSKSRSRFFVFIRPTVMRNINFESLKYLSKQETTELQIDDGWPEVKPRVIR